MFDYYHKTFDKLKYNFYVCFFFQIFGHINNFMHHTLNVKEMFPPNISMINTLTCIPFKSDLRILKQAGVIVQNLRACSY